MTTFWPWNQLTEIVQGMRALTSVVHTILANQRRIMAELDDLTSAVATLTTSVSAAAAQIKAETDKILALLAAAGTGGVDPVAVEAAATSIKGLAASLDTAVSDAKTALPTP